MSDKTISEIQQEYSTRAANNQTVNERLPFFKCPVNNS